MAPAQDALERNERNGEVTLRFGGQSYTARPPTFDEMRQLEEYADQVGPDPEVPPELTAMDLVTWAEGILADQPSLDPGLLIAGMRNQVEQRQAEIDAVRPGGEKFAPRFEEYVGWWQLLFKLCGDQPLPPAGAVPIWLGSPIARMLIVETLQHFMVFPIQGLGALYATRAQDNGLTSMATPSLPPAR